MNKSTKSERKLILRRQTLRRLDSDALARVVGAGKKDREPDGDTDVSFILGDENTLGATSRFC